MRLRLNAVATPAVGCRRVRGGHRAQARWSFNIGANRAGLPQCDSARFAAVIACGSLVPLAIEREAMTLSEIYRARAYARSVRKHERRSKLRRTVEGHTGRRNRN